MANLVRTSKPKGEITRSEDAPIIVHRTGLMPPSSGPVRTWCGRKVPIESTYHVVVRGRKLCKVCAGVIARRKRLGLWPWRKGD